MGFFSFLLEGRLDDDVGNAVGVDVGCWSAVLEIAFALSGDVTRNTNGSATVGDTIGKVANMTGFMTASKAFVVIITIDGNVLSVTEAHLVDGFLDRLDTAFGTHGSSAVVCVAAGAVPVTRDGLGVERDDDAKVFRDSVEEVTGHPEMITHVDALAGTDLELPLTGHDLGVDTRDGDTGVEAGLVVGLDDVTTKNLLGTDTAVVRTLRAGETALWPAENLTVDVEKGVLLLDTEPRVLVGVGFHDLLGFVTEVCLVGGAVGVVGLAENELVVALAEGVGKDGDGDQDDVGIVTGSLIGGGTVKVPLGKVVDSLWDRVEGLCL